MSEQLPKSYSPAEAEARVRQAWEASGLFHVEADHPGEPYAIVIPPPNVTAALHLGHAFNNTLQDVLVRVHRMRGRAALWMPGTDHAGIATQSVVEGRLRRQGRKRTDYERDEFVAIVQAWKDEYEATITEQLKSFGCSCDWDRQRFTMDPMCAAAVREAFFRLFRDGLVYRGKRLVNWDPVTLTALADDEVEMKEVDGRFYYLRYPLVHAPRNPDDPLDTEPVTWSELEALGYPVPHDARHGEDERAWVTVATPRPETYLGDTAVAVHPDDPRAVPLDGLRVQLPLVGRIIPIVCDDYVVRPDPDAADAKARYATGFLKVTPAHDPNDWEIGQRHAAAIEAGSAGAVVVNVMAPDGSISDAHGWGDVGDAHLFVGLSREDARRKVVEEFEARGLLERVEPYRHSVGHSYRSHVPIEPYLSDQWYVRVSDDRLVGEAQRALADEQFEGTKPPRADGPRERAGDGALRFFPARYARMYQSWHEGLRDWCISRQLWWGHRIPVWRRGEGAPAADAAAVLAPLLDAQDAGLVAIQQGVAPASRADLERGADLDALFVCVRDPDGAGAAVVETLEAASFVRDPDVLDTWFSSALWPLSTMGWPEPSAFPETEGLLARFNPTSVLCTGRDIVTLWVSRMVMFNRFFHDGAVPFRDVYINPMIQDGHGQRMSKSLGNGVDPRDIIHGHGADALRFTLVQMATTTQDCRMPVDMVSPHTGEPFRPAEVTSRAGYRVAAPLQTCPKTGKPMVSAYGAASGEATPSDEQPLARNTSSKFDLGRNFANKVWNATRFALRGLTAEAVDGPPRDRWAEAMAPIDRWMLTRLHRALHDVEDALEAYQFSAYAETMYDLVWRDFCDWHLEAIKPTLAGSPVQQQVLRTVLDAILRLLHPICPFVTETLWPHVRATGRSGLDGIVLGDAELLAAAPWPDVACRVDDDDAASLVGRLQEVTGAIRQARAEHSVAPKRDLRLLADDDVRALVARGDGLVETLARLEAVGPRPDDRPAGAVAVTLEGGEQWLDGLTDGVDLAAERVRLEKAAEKARKAASGYRSKLSNPGYVNNAKPEIVDETRRRLAEAEAEVAAHERALESLDA